MPDEKETVTTEAQNGIRWAELQRATNALRVAIANADGPEDESSWQDQSGALISRADAAVLLRHVEGTSDA